MEINVLGAGLAGCEAAWQAAIRGVKVNLYEMKPQKFTPAHHSDLFAELVCSNSFRSNQTSNAIGLLKEELHRLGSLIMEAAYNAEVPAGSALAVDRERFSGYITEKIKCHENITVIETECDRIPDGAVTVVATGPLTSEPMAVHIAEIFQKSFDEDGVKGERSLHFFDAAAPIVDASTIDMSKAFYASRYDKGEASYINCPMTKDEYDCFYEALITAEAAPLKDFDAEEQKDLTVFEGCMPVEVMAKRGYGTLLFGPMKPVGIKNPQTGEEYYAVVQLRQENLDKTMYNIVGFQTHLKFDEQKRVFGMIPGLENASFLRYGVMHRNTFMNSPRLLLGDYSLRKKPNVFFAGQMTGVEGYIESASSGFVAGFNAARTVLGKVRVLFPDITVIGSLANYISNPTVTNFQPMNANFGLVAPLEKKVKGGKKAKNEALAERSLKYIDEIIEELGVVR